jgi:hypothetical protein
MESVLNDINELSLSKLWDIHGGLLPSSLKEVDVAIVSHSLLLLFAQIPHLLSIINDNPGTDSSLGLCCLHH